MKNEDGNASSGRNLHVPPDLQGEWHGGKYSNGSENESRSAPLLGVQVIGNEQRNACAEQCACPSNQEQLGKR